MTSINDGAGRVVASDARLPRPPGMFRRALAAHPVAVDVFIVVWYFIGTAMGVGLDLLAASAQTGDSFSSLFGAPPHLVWPWWPLAVVRTLAVAAALLLRRKYPLSGLAVTVLAMLGTQGLTGAANAVALLFMLYAVPVFRSAAAGWVGYAMALAGTALQYLWEFVTGGGEAVDSAADILASDTTTMVRSFGDLVVLTIFSALWYLAVVLFGINLGNRRRYLEAVIDRAHQLVRERDQLARLAVAEERSRIAREMHDIVAHSVSVMIALSEGAARAASAAPDKAAEAMQRSAETGRTALAEMRRLLGALQAEGESADLVPQPGVDQLPELVRGFEDAGLTVVCEVAGAPSGDQGQELAVYRIVQEGLTNVLRYAGPGARADVTVRHQATGVEIEITDTGRPSGTTGPKSGVGSGRGLAGLAERARVFGGRIKSGPFAHADGRVGWRLHVHLPAHASTQRPSAPVAGQEDLP
ncbi:histidine kinase [Leucobacter sp. gxy201]|uniref:sensor histidine kinase n=1 Tax=Leucobacter sp. gxy201 TaxID=2957200 RepID=UPI003DA043FB